MFLLFAMALGLAGCPAKQPAPPVEPALPDFQPMTRDALLVYMQQRLEMNQPERAADPEHGEKNRLSYFGCLEQNKDDTCRFMKCNPYAFYAADEYLLAGKLDDAFTYYTAAYDLVKEEIADTGASRKKWESEYTDKKSKNEATEQDTRHFAFGRATSSQRLYVNYAMVARILQRYALVFDKQNNAEEAANAREMADNFMHSAADSYEEYFVARKELAPMLDPNDPKQKSFYISTILETDKLLELPHL